MGIGYSDLDIYKLAHELAIEVHKMTLQELPKFEIYEEGQQVRRSSKSVVMNIVEGFHRRRYKNEFIQFLIYSVASCNETIEHLNILFSTNSLRDEKIYKELREKYVELSKKITKFIQAVENKHLKPKSIVRVLLFLLLSSTIYHPPSSNPAFLDYGWGVRPEGMGGAFTSVADDVNTIFYNPAGLANLSSKEVNLMYTKPWVGLDGIDISFMHGAFSYPLDKYGNFGIGITQYDVNGIYLENTATICYGYDLARLLKFDRKILAGINLKYLGWSVKWDEEIKRQDDPVVKAGNSKSSFGVDFGLYSEPVGGLKIGLLGRNLNSPDVGLYYENKVPQEYRFGLGYNFGDLGRFEDFTTAFDISHRGQEYSEESKLQYFFGIESWLNFHTFGFRVGYNKTDVTTGLSYCPRIKQGTIRLKIDYALLISSVYTESMGSHKISFGIEF